MLRRTKLSKNEVVVPEEKEIFKLQFCIVSVMEIIFM
jgi:hypothetical protein